MSFARSSCDTFIPAKRSAPSDFEPLRISRSMAAEDPYSRHLLVDTHSPPPVPTSTRRRVNPESLAVRLGPELVKELESYVKPGAVEMPSFAIRQQIQQRHKVDRRHIYDWFHSKGLRVTKEDKRATVEQKTDAMRTQRRIRRSIAPAVPSVRACPSLSDAATDSAPSSPALPTPPVLASEFRPPSTKGRHPVISSLDHHGIVRHRPEVPYIVHPSSVTGDTYARPAPSASQTLRQATSTIALPPRPPSGYSRRFRDPQIDVVFATDEANVLDQRQRAVCYETLSRVLGPADGIQECVGSYKAHMSRQTEIYYQDFLPDSSSNSLSCSTHGLALVEDQSLASSADCLQQRDSELWSVLSAILDLPASSDWTGQNTTLPSDALALDDVLASPILRERDLPQAKSVSFAADNTFFPALPSGFLSPPILPFFDSNSSSLAGALGGPSANLARVPDSEARRKSKEWVRPRMGRARAYSAGGGM